MSFGRIATRLLKQNFIQIFKVVDTTTRVLKLLQAIRIWTFLVGMTLSFIFGVWWCSYFVPQSTGKRLCEQLQHVKMMRPQSLEEELQTRELLFIGVMTSQKFLRTRAKGVFDTWGKLVPGRMIFFAGAGKTTPGVDLPVVYLPVPDNVHPPQRKSLAMLRYIYDNFIDRFQWFIRADDDVYIRPKRLATFLRKFDSSEILLLGQAGVGKTKEQGKLGLRDGDNFCIGGPGVIMTRGVLKKVTPRLEYCSNNTVTSHEDTEVGRCLRNFAGVMCPWAYEARELFHQVYENQDQAYHDSLTSSVISKAITLHPVKDPAYMRRLHLHYLTLETKILGQKVWKLKHQVRNLAQAAAEKKSPSTIIPKRTDFFGDMANNNTISWEMFSSRQIFSLIEKKPLRWIRDSVREGLISVVRKAKGLVQVHGAAQKYHSIRFTNSILGYLKVHPVLGPQYMVNLSTVNTVRETDRDKPKRSTSTHWFKFQQPFMPLRYRLVDIHNQDTVHFVVPLAGRLSNFRRFLASFESAFLRHNKKVKLLVVYFPKLKDPSKHKKILRTYEKKYSSGVFHWLNVNTSIFQRGLALNLGAKYFGKDKLLSFTDVDLVFETEYLFRCRDNTRRGEQVYFPIMFSEFHPNISRSGSISRKLFTFHKDAGLWRIYSYGPVCAYSDDVTAVGGFSTSIKGWGLEDVEFFEKFLKPGKMNVIRSPDRGLVHVFHKHASCSPKSTFKQQKMCHDATTAYMSSASSALEYLISKGHLKM